MKEAIERHLTAMDEAYSDAAKSVGGSCEYKILFDRLLIKLCFAGKTLTPYILPAFEHLIGDAAGKSDLTVKIWDTHSTGTLLPTAPWSTAMAKTLNNILMFNQDSFHMQYNPLTQGYSLVDTQKKAAYYYVPRIPYYESSSPMRMILHWWLEFNGRYLIHAAAVGCEGNGVLLVGKGGSGKSTTALTAMMDGMDYIGDDYVVASTQPSRAYSIYNSVKVNDDILSKLPLLQELVYNTQMKEYNKWVVFLNRFDKSRIVKDLEIRAVVMPVVSKNNSTRMHIISPIKAFSEMVSSTIFQMPGSGHTTMQGLKQVTQDLPVYSLELSYDFFNNISALKKLIRSLS